MDVNSDDGEYPQLTPAVTVILATVAFFANIFAFFIILMVKQTFMHQLLQLHQFFSTIINLVHMIWIPLNFDEDKMCFATHISRNWDVAIVSLVYFCWYSSAPVVFLLSLSRYLETRKQEKMMEHPNKLIAVVCCVGLIPCILFPFRCSRPHLSLCTMSLEQYHRLSDPVCYSHSIVIPILMVLILVVLPTIIDCLTFYNLNKEVQQLGSRRTHQATIRIRQIFLGLFMCGALHLVHAARLSFYFYSNYAVLTPTVYFLMNTIIWLGQNLTESLICTLVAGLELIQQKQIIENWKRLTGTE